jgi:hypothetical protein
VFSVAERRNVLNWETRRVGRRRVPVAVTILEWHEVRDGDYGLKLEPRYREMRGGQWRLLEITGDGGKGAAANYSVRVATDEEGQSQEGTFTGADGQDLTVPPVVWYGATGEPFGEGGLPLLSLANLTLDWLVPGILRPERTAAPLRAAGDGAQGCRPPARNPAHPGAEQPG